MNVGLYQGAASLAACERWQEITAQNIASASTPGYRKSEPSFDSVLADTVKVGDGDGKELKNVMPIMAERISMQPGQLRSTGNELDFAIDGPGFFQVQKPDGSKGYTRDGEFHMSPDRTLISKQGFTVQGDGGPISFRPEGGRISINPDGTVVQGETAVGKIAVYDLDKDPKIRRIGDGLLGPGENSPAPQPIEAPSVINGTLEGSNVQPLREMVNLIALSRSYESSQRVMQANDEATDKAIQTLGNPS